MINALERAKNDLAYALRGLRRSPTFATVVILTIAIGIGANATVLGIIDKSFVRKLPVPDAGRIVRVACEDTTGRRVTRGCSFPEADALNRQARGVEGIAGYLIADVRLGGDYAGVNPHAAFVTGNYFNVLGVTPQLGRLILPPDADPRDVRNVVVISDMLWRSTFGADPGIAGKVIRIGGGDFTVVGVARPLFTGLKPEGRTDVWLPWTVETAAKGSDAFSNPSSRSIGERLVGRLQPGRTLGDLQASLAAAARENSTNQPELYARRRYTAEQYALFVEPEGVRNALPGFLIAWGVIALLHLIVCSNVASLLLARAATRRRELGIRLCLGASQSRIVALSLAEPVLLAIAGGAAGVVVYRWLTGLVTSMDFMAAMDPGTDLRVLGLLALVSLGSALACGMAPTMAAVKQDPLEVIRSSAPRDRNGSAGSSLVSWQVAMSLALLTQAMLLVGKYRGDQRNDIGFDRENVVTVQLRSRTERIQKDEWEAALTVALERAKSVPGVVSVSASRGIPLGFGGWFEDAVVVGSAVGNAPQQTSFFLTGPGYFQTLGARIISGREFTDADRRQPQSLFPAAIVNEAFARRQWPGKEPVGQTVVFRGKPVTVVGLVANMRDIKMTVVVPRVYVPLLAWSYPSFVILARVKEDPVATGARLRSALVDVPAMVPGDVRTMSDLILDNLSVPRYLGMALSVCGGIALLLCALGLYGVMTTWAAAKRPEIGVRLALGATTSHVHAILLRNAVKLTASGAGVGALVSALIIWAERRSYGPSMRFDPTAVVLALAVFASVTFVAAFVPAHRAAKANPADVLRPQ
jgi:predicted permease